MTTTCTHADMGSGSSEAGVAKGARPGLHLPPHLCDLGVSLEARLEVLQLLALLLLDL
eukprot:CAMPEP_0175354030 /NCGR_PEP_ID=MMETSP0095-20121207/12743_1 /TAXON_ID=311494 /ORGANISM="Alexandrium monilatum, Strain CCMP3105" /LENGTH=57 /DNA_ID=CAMNT_0016651657 /DNA_START=329 /DNA_END=499 /DNA_ORIENTATION=+